MKVSLRIPLVVLVCCRSQFLLLVFNPFLFFPGVLECLTLFFLSAIGWPSVGEISAGLSLWLSVICKKVPWFFPPSFASL